MSYAILNTEYNELFVRTDEDDIAEFETKLEAFQEINRQCARNVEIWGLPFRDRYELIELLSLDGMRLTK